MPPRSLLRGGAQANADRYASTAKDGAFDLLVPLSNAGNRKLREIAQDIVDEVLGDAPG